eukprot:scaffold4942_cov106-Isochrysis_galbana.AAC.2
MIDSLTDTALTKGRERSAPGMSHADTHTPLHGPTGGVPSDFRQARHSPTPSPPSFLRKQPLRASALWCYPYPLSP